MDPDGGGGVLPLQTVSPWAHIKEFGISGFCGVYALTCAFCFVIQLLVISAADILLYVPLSKENCET